MLKKVIKIVFVVILIAVVVLLISDTIQTNPQFISKKLIKMDVLESKEINFLVKYLKIIPLGEASLKNLGIEKYKRRDVYHLVGEANTLAFLSSIFKAKARVDSFVDVKKQHSLAFLEHSEVSNKPDEDKTIIFDQKRNIMRIRDEERKILPNSQDPLSAIFYIQQQSFHVGKMIILYMNTNQKNYDLNSKVVSKHEISLGEKKFNIWLLKADIKRHDKSPRHSSNLKIWFLENPEKNKKVPILIRAMTNVGPITAYLLSAK